MLGEVPRALGDISSISLSLSFSSCKQSVVVAQLHYLFFARSITDLNEIFSILFRLIILFSFYFSCPTLSRSSVTFSSDVFLQRFNSDIFADFLDDFRSAFSSLSCCVWVLPHVNGPFVEMG